MTLEYHPVCVDDAAPLAALRVAAMRPSLEAVGRFDPTRARQRFLDKFVPQATTKLVSNGQLIGFYVLIEEPDHFWLDHLYLLPAFQGHGYGQQVVARIKALARARQFSIHLCALRDSPANGFYQQQGFQLRYEEEWDLYYQWLGD